MVKIYPGGYVMVDMGGIDILSASSASVPGIYDAIEDAMKTGKLIELNGITYDGIAVSPVATSFREADGSFIGTVGTYSISISSEDGVTFSDFTGMTPAAPTSPSAEQTEDGILISWTAAAGARNYRVSRRKLPGTTYYSVDLNVIGTSCLDTSVLSAGDYQYAISAQNSYGISSAVTKTITIE